jgi:hypothetical protein
VVVVVMEDKQQDREALLVDLVVVVVVVMERLSLAVRVLQIKDFLVAQVKLQDFLRIKVVVEVVLGKQVTLMEKHLVEMEYQSALLDLL